MIIWSWEDYQVQKCAYLITTNDHFNHNFDGLWSWIWLSWWSLWQRYCRWSGWSKCYISRLPFKMIMMHHRRSWWSSFWRLGWWSLQMTWTLAKSHIKLSFIARVKHVTQMVTCDTQWVLSAESPTVRTPWLSSCIYNLYQVTPGPEKVHISVTQM